MVRRFKPVLANIGIAINRFRVYAFGRYRHFSDTRRVSKEIAKAEKIEHEDGELVIIYGGLGAGKTTYLCQIGQGYLNDGRKVYTNIPGTPFVEMPKDYYNYRYPRGSCILIDEIGILHDNRQYKTLPEQVRDWYKYVRHHSIHVFAASQTADVDKKIRVLAMEQEVLKKERFLLFFEFVYSYLIVPQIGYIDKETQRFVAEDYFEVVSRRRLHLRKHYAHHNSHSELDLPMFD